jgi:hypothetical protein
VKPNAVSPILSTVLFTLFLIVAGVMMFEYVGIPKIEKPVFAHFEIVEITKDTSPEELFEDQIVVIRYTGSDSLNAENLEVILKIYRNNALIKSCRLCGFPWKITTALPNESVYGDQIIDMSTIHYSNYVLCSKVLKPGESFGFRIKKKEIVLKKGDVIEVTIIHRGAVISKFSKTYR